VKQSTVAVIGLGLMGGSVVRALAQLPGGPRVLGASPDARDREAAARVDGLTVVADARDVIGEADMIVYAAPLAPILDMLPEHAPLLRADAVLTDVAGLKRPVLECARRADLADRFVGAHPMAGGEGSGFEEGRADLFRGAHVWLCGGGGVERRAAIRVEHFWADLGARPEWTDPETHDELMEKVSQLPQLVSNALALALERTGVKASDLGPGGRDMTRLAKSSPHMWRDLLTHTGPDLAGLLREVTRWTEELAAKLEAGEVDAVAELMDRTRKWRGPDAGR
jgi:cyclohexadieny/prephenate dehydrogenase